MNGRLSKNRSVHRYVCYDPDGLFWLNMYVLHWNFKIVWLFNLSDFEHISSQNRWFASQKYEILVFFSEYEYSFQIFFKLSHLIFWCWLCGIISFSKIWNFSGFHIGTFQIEFWISLLTSMLCIPGPRRNPSRQSIRSPSSRTLGYLGPHVDLRGPFCRGQYIF